MKTVTIEISDERAAAVLAAYGSKEAVLEEIRNTLSAGVQKHLQRIEDAKVVVVPKPDYSDLTGDIVDSPV